MRATSISFSVPSGWTNTALGTGSIPRLSCGTAGDRRTFDDCPTPVVSSGMLHRIFAPASVDSLFSDAALLAAMARFERGLAQAQAAAGIIPESAAQAIVRACNELGDPAASDGSPPDLAGGRFDPARLYPAARNAGTLVIPFLKALGEQVATIDADA